MLECMTRVVQTADQLCLQLLSPVYNLTLPPLAWGRVQSPASSCLFAGEISIDDFTFCICRPQSRRATYMDNAHDGVAHPGRPWPTRKSGMLL